MQPRILSLPFHEKTWKTNLFWPWIQLSHWKKFKCNGKGWFCPHSQVTYQRAGRGVLVIARHNWKPKWSATTLRYAFKFNQILVKTNCQLPSLYSHLPHAVLMCCDTYKGIFTSLFSILRPGGIPWDLLQCPGHEAPHTVVLYRERPGSRGLLPCRAKLSKQRGNSHGSRPQKLQNENVKSDISRETKAPWHFPSGKSEPFICPRHRGQSRSRVPFLSLCLLS